MRKLELQPFRLQVFPFFWAGLSSPLLFLGCPLVELHYHYGLIADKVRNESAMIP